MNHHTLVSAILAVIVAGSAAVLAGEETERILRKNISIQAPLEKVWRAWTTEEGLAPVSGTSNVELRVGGPYEWFLDLEPDENGLKGGQGSRILAFLPGEVLAFDWTFPPSIPSLRRSRAKTQVVIQFDEPEDGVVRVRFAQLGWGKGDDWDEGYTYFDKAWDWVLQRMKETLEEAPESSPANLRVPGQTIQTFLIRSRQASDSFASNSSRISANSQRVPGSYICIFIIDTFDECPSLRTWHPYAG